MMSNKFLQRGDVINLQTETVYATVPQHFLYSNRRGDFSMAHGEVCLADKNFDYLRGSLCRDTYHI